MLCIVLFWLNRHIKMCDVAKFFKRSQTYLIGEVFGVILSRKKTISYLWLTGVPLRCWSTHWCVNEVEEVALPLVAVEQRGCLSLDSDAPLSLHLKFVQNLFVLFSLCNSTYKHTHLSLNTPCLAAWMEEVILFFCSF